MTINKIPSFFKITKGYSSGRHKIRNITRYRTCYYRINKNKSYEKQTNYESTSSEFVVTGTTYMLHPTRFSTFHTNYTWITYAAVNINYTRFYAYATVMNIVKCKNENISVIKKKFTLNWALLIRFTLLLLYFTLLYGLCIIILLLH